ncbi:tetratricopeptide repeat protein [Bythopirellula polymerisocia]|uniref:tetratricopeptide repeat protein n=1 Tax=Bythopirellula polymerisocia TaxID=2528003 RepID=UPI0011B753EE
MPQHVAHALINRGITYFQGGNHQQAIADYKNAIELPGAPPDKVKIALLLTESFGQLDSLKKCSLIRKGQEIATKSGNDDLFIKLQSLKDSIGCERESH